MKITKTLCILIALCSLVFILTACGSKKEPVQEEIVTPIQEENVEENIVTPQEEEIVNMPNPIVEYDTVEDAVIHVGHLCTTPDIYARYNQKASVIADTLIQIVYSNDSGDILTLREESRPSGDISGNYNVYSYNKTIEIDGNDVTIKGDSEDSIYLVTWNDGKYSHSLDYENGVSLEEVKTAVSAIK